MKHFEKKYPIVTWRPTVISTPSSVPFLPPLCTSLVSLRKLVTQPTQSPVHAFALISKKSSCHDSNKMTSSVIHCRQSPISGLDGAMVAGVFAASRSNIYYEKPFANASARIGLPPLNGPLINKIRSQLSPKRPFADVVRLC